MDSLWKSTMHCLHPRSYNCQPASLGVLISYPTERERLFNTLTIIPRDCSFSRVSMARTLCTVCTAAASAALAGSRSKNQLTCYRVQHKHFLGCKSGLSNTLA